MEEVLKVAGAAGYRIPKEKIDSRINRMRGLMKTGGKEPSMLTDVRESRPLEVEAILGNAVQIARTLHVDTPTLDVLYALAKGLSFSISPDKPWIPLA
jgi:2-dehydropantoate 2-reductase